MPSELIDEGCRRRFEQARRFHPAALLADFLPAAADPAYLAMLEELVLIDLEFGWKDAGPGMTGPLVDDYLRRFPRLAQRSIAFRLLRHEYELRLARGEVPKDANTAGQDAKSVKDAKNRQTPKMRPPTAGIGNLNSLRFLPPLIPSRRQELVCGTK
jgi:hypothetical protein